MTRHISSKSESGRDKTETIRNFGKVISYP